MRDLTISQEYLICAVNEKGTLFTFNTEKMVCLVAAALLELQLEGCVTVDKKYITGEKAHLRPLYDYLKGDKPMRTEKLLEEYTYSITDARLKELMAAIGDSLVGRGLVEPVQSGLLGRKQGYRPTREAIHSVVDLVRAELLEEGEVTEDVAALVILLDQGKCLKPYFSAFEQKEMQANLQAIAKTPSGKAVRDMVEYVENLIAIMTVLVTVFT